MTCVSRFFPLLCLCPVVFVRPAIASGQHLICKAVDDVFTDSTAGAVPGPRETQARGIQGQPGKRGPAGPRGAKGKQGIKGEQGHVDYKRISDIIEKKVAEEMEGITKQLIELRKNVSDLMRNEKARGLVESTPVSGIDAKEPNERTTAAEVTCGSSELLYHGVCYSVPILNGANSVSRSLAAKKCRDSGYQMAQIHDKTQQEKLANFIRPKIPSSVKEVHLWIGTTYNPAKKVIRYESGTEVASNHLHWWPAYPQPELYRKYMLLGVKRDGKGGVWSYKEWNSHGVICEKKS